MSPRPTLCALGVIALASAPGFGQFVAPHYSVGRIGSQVIVRPPIYTFGFGAFNPNAVVPAVSYGFFANDTGLRRSYWSLPGRYNAYPWSGAGVFTGGTLVNAFYAPSLWWGAGCDCAWAAPYGGYGYFGDASGYLFHADAPVVGAYRNSLPENAAASAVPADRAMLSVQAPSDAKLWVQGEETKQTSGDRVFTSPPLKPDQDYTYIVKAQWMVDDKTVEQSQKVTVRAGQRSGLLFLSGTEAAAGR